VEACDATFPKREGSTLRAGAGKRGRTVAAAVALGTVLGLTAWPAHAQDAARPHRIVSLDLCTDQLLIELAERGRIAAVTHLAADPAVSAIPDKAKGIPITRGAAEDVLRYDPDLVLAGPYGVSPTVGLLRRLDRNVVVVPLAADLDGVRASVRAVAKAVGEEVKGEEMIAAFDRSLASLAPASGLQAPTAVIYQVGGSVSGAGSLADAALAAAGFRNLATAYRLTRGGQVPLEVLVATPPDLIVLSSAAEEYRTVAADNLRHPALRLLRQRQASIELPWQLWLCGTPHIADVVARLAKARAGIEAQQR
jgi:iron complex transport system substrate-binding protein